MKTFRLKADITFDAEDLSAAFVKLADHFIYCDEPEKSGAEALDFEGEMKLETE